MSRRKYMDHTAANFFITASATFNPSIAAEVIPPAYPAPSPHGQIHDTDEVKSSPRSMRTGDEVRLSTPDRRTSPPAKPWIFLSMPRMPDSREAASSHGKIFLTFPNAKAPFILGVILPKLLLLFPAQKSANLCTGMLPFPSSHARFSSMRWNSTPASGWSEP